MIYERNKIWAHLELNTTFNWMLYCLKSVSLNFIPKQVNDVHERLYNFSTGQQFLKAIDLDENDILLKNL